MCTCMDVHCTGTATFGDFTTPKRFCVVDIFVSILYKNFFWCFYDIFVIFLVKLMLHRLPEGTYTALNPGYVV